MDAELKNTVLVNLRCVTQSVKGGVPLERLQRDYRDLLGEHIPYQKLGYNSLESFVRDIPDTIRVARIDGQLMAEGVADSSTAHIASLVARQRQTKTKPRGARRPVVHRRGGLTSRFAPRPTGYQGKNFNPNYKPSYFNVSRPRPRTPPPQSVQMAAPSNLEPRPESRSQPFKYYKDTKTKTLAPRFLRLQQRKLEEQQRLQAANSFPLRYTQSSLEPSTPPDSPPRVPSPQQEVIRPTSPPVQPQLLPVFDEYSLDNHVLPPRPLQSRNNQSRVDMLKQLESASSAKEYVSIYAKKNNMAVNYSTQTIGQKKKRYISKLFLGNSKTFHCYPNSASTKEEAEELVAEDAVNDIQVTLEDLALFPETSITTAEEIHMFQSRIEEIVCEKPSGMFTNGIMKEYENKFHESLASSWLDLLKDSPHVDIEEIGVTYGRVPEGVKYILRPSKVPSSGNTTPSSSSSKTDLPNEFTNKMSMTSPVNQRVPHIPKLDIPNGNEWEVYVTHVSDTIAVRLIEYDGIFLELTNAMSVFYASHYIPVLQVAENQLYAMVASREPLEIQRVLVHKCLEDDMVECYFPDEGSITCIKKSELQELDPSFHYLPYQALHMILDELEEFESFITPEEWKRIEDQVLIAQIKSWNTPFQGYFPEFPGLHNVIYSVVLFNTSGSEDINLNEILKLNALESLTSELPKISTPCQGYLSHVTETGEIYLRFLNPIESWLEEYLEKLTPVFEESCLETQYSNIKETIFVAKYENDKWYRALMVNSNDTVDNPEKVEVFYVDYGNTGIIPLTHTCELIPHSELLSSIGIQAMQCELYKALPSPTCKWTLKAIARLYEFAPVSEKLIIKVMEEGSENSLPKVSLHKRIYMKEDSFIISINDNLANHLPNLFLELSSAESKSSIHVPTKLNLHISQKQQKPNSLNTTVPTSPGAAAENGFKSLIATPSPANNSIHWMTTPDNIKSPDAFEDQCSAPLRLPDIPMVGEILDVFVTMAANPLNFMVQDLKSAQAMNDLLKEMQQFYSSEENLIEIPESLLQENEYYAAYHSDHHTWYRVRLETIFNVDPILAAVYYVDFGDYQQLNMQNLQIQRLYNKFRTLPCQALKASLAGIKPIEGDWKPDHCVLFRDMVMEKKFASVIQKKNLVNNKDFSYFELDLTLIDTSTSQDVYINELLINKSMACAL